MKYRTSLERATWKAGALLAFIVQTMGSVGLSAADTVAPRVSISSPTPNSTVSGVFNVIVTASDDTAMESVSLKLDGASIASPLTSPPYSFNVDSSKLVNGSHTLLAIARDLAGNYTRSSLVSLTITNRKSLILSTEPMVVENLGTVLSANVQEGNQQWMFRHPQTGGLHLLLYYNTSKYSTYPIQILHVNLATSTARLVNSIPGRPGPIATLIHPNGKVYLGSYNPGYLFEYDPITGATNLIGKLHPTQYRDAQTLEVATDGQIYIGQYTHVGGGLARYNPSTGVFQDLGIMDTSFNAPQYGYTVGMDSNYAYVGLGQLPWYLAIHNLSTRTTTLFWKTANDLGGQIYRAKAGGWYYRRKLANNTLKWYNLTGGAPVEIATPAASAYYDYTFEKPSLVKASGSFLTTFNTEINLDKGYPSSDANRATVAWRTVGTSTWRTATVSNGFILEPVIVKQLYTSRNNQLLGFTDFYGPVFTYDPIARKASTLGMPQYELYDAIQQVGGMTYLSGYTSVTLAYDPDKPWTLTGAVNSYVNTNINPYKIDVAWGKYHRYSTFGSDGLVYFGINHLRNSLGGELSWYDPNNRSSGSLRNPFLNDDVQDLKSALGGTKLVYASYSTYKNTDAKLFVFDVATKTVERQIVPIPGAIQLDKIVEVSPGIIFGAVSTNIFKVDIRTGAILYKKTIPGEALDLDWSTHEYDHRITLGPDGFIWMFMGNALYRIEPQAGTFTKLLNTPAKTILFHGLDIYLYGGPTLYRIRNVLKPIESPLLLNVEEK